MVTPLENAVLHFDHQHVVFEFTAGCRDLQTYIATADDGDFGLAFQIRPDRIAICDCAEVVHAVQVVAIHVQLSG